MSARSGRFNKKEIVICAHSSIKNYRQLVATCISDPQHPNTKVRLPSPVTVWSAQCRVRVVFLNSRLTAGRLHACQVFAVLYVFAVIAHHCTHWLALAGSSWEAIHRNPTNSSSGYAWRLWAPSQRELRKPKPTHPRSLGQGKGHGLHPSFSG